MLQEKSKNHPAAAKKKNKVRLAAFVSLVLTLALLAGCDTAAMPGGTSGTETSGSEIPAAGGAGEGEAQAGTEMPQTPEIPVIPEIPEIDFEAVRPNELGEVMVIMYHNLGDKNTDYARTADAFRADLKRLYDMGFRTLSLRDLVQGNITTPAGFTPVVLTFDDGHVTSFRLLEDGSVDPDCVVGIMSAFAEAHPDFGMHATFFLNGGTPFGQKDAVDFKLKYLLEHGMDLGNHSFGHEHFKPMSAEAVEVTLGRNAAELEAMLPEDYEIDLLALPYGERPAEGQRSTLVEGQYQGSAYRHLAILNVGWKPSVSPFDARFDFTSIQRVQSGDGHLQLSDWLDGYGAHPEKRFVSDGRADRVVVPERLKDQADLTGFEGLTLMTYDDAAFAKE